MVSLDRVTITSYRPSILTKPLSLTVWPYIRNPNLGLDSQRTNGTDPMKNVGFSGGQYHSLPTSVWKSANHPYSTNLFVLEFSIFFTFHKDSYDSFSCQHVTLHSDLDIWFFDLEWLSEFFLQTIHTLYSYNDLIFSHNVYILSGTGNTSPRPLCICSITSSDCKRSLLTIFFKSLTLFYVHLPTCKALQWSLIPTYPPYWAHVKDHAVHCACSMSRVLEVGCQKQPHIWNCLQKNCKQFILPSTLNT